MKHEQIITSLSSFDKIKLITNTKLDDVILQQLGINTNEIFVTRKFYVDSLTNCKNMFSKEAYKKLNYELEQSFLENNLLLHNISLTTSIAVNSLESIYSVSEDPYYNKIFLKNVFLNKKIPYLCNFDFCKDIDFDSRAYNEIYKNVLDGVLSTGNVDCFFLSSNKVNNIYQYLDSQFINKLKIDYKFNGVFISDCSKNPLEQINNGISLIVGFNKDLKTLVECFNKALEYKNLLKDGSITKDEYDEQIKLGYILPEDILNDRVSNVLDLIYKLENAKKTLTSIKDYDDIDNGVLVLKNNNIIPNKKNIHIIGPLPDKVLEYVKNYSNISGKYNIKSYYKGYDNFNNIDLKELKSEIKNIDSYSDIVLLYINSPYDRVKKTLELQPFYTLSQSQITLIQTLTNKKLKVLCVSACPVALNLKFIELLDGFISHKINNVDDFNLLLDTIHLNKIPSGYNPLSICSESKDIFPKSVSGGKIRNFESIFNGYRYYSSINKKLHFDFLYNYKFTNISYSNFFVEKNYCELDVSNNSDKDVSDLVSIFFSKPDSLILRESKKLIGFEKVTIKAHETKRVRIPIDESSYLVYVKFLKDLRLESGAYNILISNSLTNILHKEVINISGNYDFKDEKKEVIDDYILYKNKIYKSVPSKKTTLSVSTKLIINIPIIIGFIIGAVFGIMGLNKVKISDTVYTISVVAILGFIGVYLILFLLSLFKEEYEYKKEEDVLDADSGIKEKIEEKIEEKEDKKEVVLEVIPEYIEDNKKIENQFIRLDFEELSNDFNLVLESNELYIDTNYQKEFFSAMCASKIIFVKHNNEVLFDKFCESVSNFFKTPNYIVSEFESWKTSSDLVYYKAFSDNPLLKAIINSISHSDTINVVQLKKVHINQFKEYFQDILDNVLKRTISTGIVLNGPKNIIPEIFITEYGTLQFPKNLWFLVELDDEEEYTLSNSLFGKVIHMSLEISSTTKSELAKDIKTPNYYELVEAINFSKENILLQENFWKKLDDLEEFIQKSFEKFYFTNNIIRQAECYSSILISFGLDNNLVLDKVLTNIILPYIKDYILKLVSKDLTIYDIINRYINIDDMQEVKNYIKQLNIPSSLDSIEEDTKPKTGRKKAGKKEDITQSNDTKEENKEVKKRTRKKEVTKEEE